MAGQVAAPPGAGGAGPALQMLAQPGVPGLPAIPAAAGEEVLRCVVIMAAVFYCFVCSASSAFDFLWVVS